VFLNVSPAPGGLSGERRRGGGDRSSGSRPAGLPLTALLLHPTPGAGARTCLLSPGRAAQVPVALLIGSWKKKSGGYRRLTGDHRRPPERVRGFLPERSSEGEKKVPLRVNLLKYEDGPGPGASRSAAERSGPPPGARHRFSGFCTRNRRETFEQHAPPIFTRRDNWGVSSSSSSSSRAPSPPLIRIFVCGSRPAARATSWPPRGLWWRARAPQAAPDWLTQVGYLSRR